MLCYPDLAEVDLVCNLLEATCDDHQLHFFDFQDVHVADLEPLACDSLLFLEVVSIEVSFRVSNNRLLLNASLFLPHEQPLFYREVRERLEVEYRKQNQQPTQDVVTHHRNFVEPAVIEILAAVAASNQIRWVRPVSDHRRISVISASVVSIVGILEARPVARQADWIRGGTVVYHCVELGRVEIEVGHVWEAAVIASDDELHHKSHWRHEQAQ